MFLSFAHLLLCLIGILGVEIRGRGWSSLLTSLLLPPPSSNLPSRLPSPLLSSLSPPLLSISVLTSPLCTPLILPHPQQGLPYVQAHLEPVVFISIPNTGLPYAQLEKTLGFFLSELEGEREGSAMTKFMSKTTGDRKRY